MSLRGYKKKWKPALWTQLPGQKKNLGGDGVTNAAGRQCAELQAGIRSARTSTLSRGPKAAGVIAPLSQSSAVRRRYIKPVSDRMRGEKAAYRREARAFVRERRLAGQTCPVVNLIACLKRGTKYGHPISNKLNEVHHVRGRLGRLLRDQRFWLAVSKQGHRWIHEHPAQARRYGWLCERGQWNVAP